MDQMILETQKWLNTTYKGVDGFRQIPENGQTGWTTTNALLVALQIEEGVSTSTIESEIANGSFVFGESTKARFSPLSASTDYSSKTNKNKLRILQGGFWCKGISPGGFGDVYTPRITEAINTLQRNAGIPQTGIADVLVFQALLSMNQFVVIKRLGGDEKIASIQRSLNAKYANDRGFLIPCDGIYGRDLTKALIYSLQRTEGLSISDANKANGYFGKGTKDKCPVLRLGDSGYFVTLLQYALYCNGFTNLSFTGTFDEATKSQVLLFQNRMNLTPTGGKVVGLDTWMALLLSSGNPDIKVKGCDAAQTISPSDAKILKSNGYEIIGRYISGRFATSIDELTGILNSGLNVFPIYETGGYEPSYFVNGQGSKDAVSAVQVAKSLGIPEGTVIYFTVDYDMQGYQIDNLVIPYFKEIYDKFNNAQLNYRIGIYGARNVCSKVINEGYAQVAFVAGASTGFSGNMGFPMPRLWSFNQVKVDINVDGIGLDNDQVSGLDMGFSYVEKGDTLISKPSTPSSAEPTQEDNLLKDFFDFITQDFLNIKFENKNNKFISKRLYGDPFYFANGNAYVRLESGYKIQALSGGDVNIYITDKDFSIDLLPNGAGVNIIPKEFIESKSIQDMLKSVIPTGYKGNLQFYPYWSKDDGTNPNYYEFGLEYGISITPEKIIQFMKHPICKKDYDESELQKLFNIAGEYVFVDVIIGLKKSTFTWAKYAVKTISEVAVVTTLLKMLEYIKNGTIKLVDGIASAIDELAKALLDALLDPNTWYEFISHFIQEVIVLSPEIIMFGALVLLL